MLNAAIPDQNIRDAMPMAFRGALRILESWGLSHDESAAVLGLEPRTLYRHKRGGLPARSVAADLIERTSYVLGIEKALEILLAGQAAQEAEDIHHWINNPSDAALFAGKPPRALITTGRVADLFRVRQYLDGWRGGDFG